MLYMRSGDKDDKYELLGRIRELEFVEVDLNLFLDNHPDNKQAINDYNMFSEKLAALKSKYEETYGTLCNFGNGKNCSSFTWVEEPWPWEKTE